LTGKRESPVRLSCDFPTFEIGTGVIASFYGLSIENGSVVDDGGGIDNAGRLNVSNGTFADNGAAHGGGIMNAGTLMVNQCTFEAN
jgi:hypothetical protein